MFMRPAFDPSFWVTLERQTKGRRYAKKAPSRCGERNDTRDSKAKRIYSHKPSEPDQDIAGMATS